MIIFDDLSIDREELLKIKAYISNLETWQIKEEDPIIESIDLVIDGSETYDIAEKLVKWSDSFAHRNRIDISKIVNIKAIKLNKKENKEEIDFEEPRYEPSSLSTLIFFLDDSDAHMFIFNEGEEADKDDLTVYTMFSPVAGRGFVLDNTKWHAYSMPSGIDAQYLIKVDFEGKIVSNQASTVYDLE
jgi:hypothetical protein